MQQKVRLGQAIFHETADNLQRSSRRHARGIKKNVE